MKYVVEGMSYSYREGIVNFGATVRVVSDDYDASAGTGTIFHQDSISESVNVNDPSDWFARAKASLLDQARYIRDKYLETMTTVASKTGLASEAEILANIKASLEGGLN